FEFFPKVEGEILSAKLEMPLGAPFSETQRVIKKLEEAALQLGDEISDTKGNPVIVNVLATSGMQPFQGGFSPGGPATGTHLGEVTLELAPAKDRQISSAELKVKWQELVGNLPGVVALSFTSETAGGGNAIDINLTGSDSEQLGEAANWATEQLKSYEGVIEVSNSDRRGREELIVRDLTTRGKALGFNLANVMGQVRDAFYGNEVQRLQRGRDEVKVMVRYPEEERRSLANLEQMKLRNPQGGEVPLMEVVEPDYGRGPATITRVDRFRTISLKGDVDLAAGYNSNEIVGRFTEEVLDVIGEKFPGVRYTYEGEQSDQRDSVREMMIGFVGALMLMYVLMAIPLKSYIQPLIVMSVIPFGLVGAIAGHILLGLNLSIMSMCGIVALAGVVVNDSLVLVDYVNRHRGKGVSVREAATRAGARRFRPILLTSLTTFAGLMPMLLETDMQANFPLIVHELAHLQMHGYLWRTPPWFYEGVAEYLAASHEKGGIFNFTKMDEKVRNRIKRQTDPEAGKNPAMAMAKLVRLDSRNWHRLTDTKEPYEVLESYSSSLLLIHYFFNGGDERRGEVAKYLEEVQKVRDFREEMPELFTAEQANEIQKKLVKYWGPRGLKLQFR
ncbi:efflux RND transporter permease subunit, partial [Akkermansiaceae bacterium]|nr:efflux RND transporter permease subunit [Akkermansiaceae bacterium]